MRAFLAIDMPDDVADALERLQRRLPACRPTPRANLHLTLAFLDDQPEDQLEALHFELEALHSPGFDLRLTGLGQFGHAASGPVFVAAEPCDGLLELHRQITGDARRAGIALARGRYHPHVTIARCRPERGAAHRLREFFEENQSFTLPAFAVTGYALYRSTLRPQGALHEELAGYDLARH